VAEIVTLAELRTSLGATVSAPDAELTQLIDRVEAMAQGEDGVRQRLVSRASTEKYDGDNSSYLSLKAYPVTTLTAVTIEDEATVNVADTNVVRVWGGHSLVLISRIFPRGKPDNVTVQYTAGYTSVKTSLPDMWALILEAAGVLYGVMKSVRSSVAAQSFADGSISYMAKTAFPREFYETRWLPTIKAHRRGLRARSVTATPEHAIGSWGAWIG